MLLTRPLFAVLLLMLVLGSESHALGRRPKGEGRITERRTCLIGAFNAKTFGKTKMTKPNVVAVLVAMIQRYDVLLIQEIRDSSGEAIQQLLELVNEPDQSNGSYSMTISERLGRTSYKEQYAFFYKSNVTDTHSSAEDTGRPGPRPHGQGPRGPGARGHGRRGSGPHGRRPRGVRPHHPHHQQSAPHGPRPHDPCPHGPRPHGPSHHGPRPHGPPPHGQRPHGAGIMLLDTYQFDDGLDDGTDWFEREPYAVLFSVPHCDVKKIAMVASHVKPSDAVAELNRLDDVMRNVSNWWSTDNVLLMGGLNADCSYITATAWLNIDLNQVDYSWLIPDSADTTVVSTDCAYDRFVVNSNVTALASRTAVVYRFDEEFNLTSTDALAVSGNYPVDLEL